MTLSDDSRLLMQKIMELEMFQARVNELKAEISELENKMNEEMETPF